MVLSRTIENLKERPKHEREAVAFWISVAVVILLLLGWGVFFFRSLASTTLQPVSDAYTDAVAQAQGTKDQAQKNIDTTGWVSSASQTSAAATPDQIQIIQQDDVPQADIDVQEQTDDSLPVTQ